MAHLSQTFKDALDTPGVILAMWLEIEGIDFAWGTAGGLGASAFLHRAERFRRTAAKALLRAQPAGVEQEARPMEGDSSIGSLVVDLVDDGSSDLMALLAGNSARTDDLLVSQVEKTWAPSTAYVVGDLVRPRLTSTATGNRHWFRCTTAGTSTATEPVWPTGGTIADGAALVWTTQGPQDLPADLKDARIPYAGTASATAYPTGGGVVYLGRETLKYTARTTAPNGGGFLDGCKRGWFELDGLSQPLAHTAGDLVSPYARFVATRRARLYIAPGPVTNVVKRSQEFDDAAWTKGNATATANTWAAPDGTTTGDTITDNATSGQHFAQQSLGITGSQQLAVSLFVHTGGTIPKCRISLNATGGPIFDLVAKSIFSAGDAGGTAKVTDLGGDVLRLEWVVALVPTSLTIALFDGADVYVGTGKTLRLWGAQVRYGDVAGRYVATTDRPASATTDTGAAVARYAGIIRRPTMARGLASGKLEVDGAELETRVTAMSNRRSFKIAAGLEAGDFVNKDAASVTDLTAYERPDEQSPVATTTTLKVDLGSMSGDLVRDREMGQSRTWRVGDEYVQGILDLTPSTGSTPILNIGQLGGGAGAALVTGGTRARGYFSSHQEQHDPGDEVLEVLVLGAAPRFEEFFFDGALLSKIDFVHDGTVSVATVLPDTAVSANRFRTAAALALKVKEALFAAWPNAGTNFWTVSFDSGGRCSIGYSDATAHVIELLWRTGVNAGASGTARSLLGYAKRDVRLATPGDVAKSGEPALPFHYAEEPGHPLDVALRLLLSRGDGSNGTYDVLPRGSGAGIDQTRVDVAGIESLRDAWMPEAQHFEVVDEPFTLKDKIASILRAHGCYLTSLLDDKITVKRMTAPVPGVALRAIDASVVLEPADWRLDPDRAIGRVLFLCDHDPGNDSTEIGPWRQRFRNELQGPGIEVQEFYAGIFRAHEIEAPGQWTGNNLVYGGRFGPNLGTGAAEAAQRLNEIVRERAARPLPEIEVPSSYDLVDAEVGDLATVTLANVPDVSKGTRGLMSTICEIRSKSAEEDRGVVRLVLAQTAYGAQMRLLAPTGKVTTTQTSATIALGAVYSPPGAANEASQFAVGDVVEVFDPTLKTSRGTGTVSAVGATSITVGAAIAQTAGDIVLLRPFTTQSAARKAKSAFLADGSPQAALGGGAAHVFAS